METQKAVTDGTAPPPLSATSAEYHLLALDKIRESRSNPRKWFDKLKEADLEASIREKGVLVPIKVRPAEKGYELVYGARRYRASLAAGRTVIPALVQVLSDKEVLEEQVVENVQRSDVHPLEEADGYHELIQKHGYTGAALAAKVGKSPQYLAERLKLRELVEPARKAFYEEKIGGRVALLIARIPAQLQAQAVKVFTAREGLITVREAAEYIHENFMLRLEEAPFSTTDAALVAKAGPCSTCPKRTGNQRELFADVKSPDICTDPVCFRSKVDAVWLQKVATAKAAGQKVLEPAEAKKAFESYDGTAVSYSSGFVDAHDKQWVGEKNVEAHKLLEKAKPGSSGTELVLARDAKGHIRELLPRKLVEAAAEIERGKGTTKKKKGEGGGRLRSSTTQYDREEKERERKARFRAQVVNAAMPQIVEAVEKSAKKDAGAALRFIAERVLRRSFHDGLTKTARRREVKDPETILKRLNAVETEGLAGLVVEVIAYDGATGGTWGSTYSDDFRRACSAFKVDLKKIEVVLAATSRARAEAAAAKKAPAPKKAKKARGAK